MGSRDKVLCPRSITRSTFLRVNWFYLSPLIQGRIRHTPCATSFGCLLDDAGFGSITPHPFVSFVQVYASFHLFVSFWTGDIPNPMFFMALFNALTYTRSPHLRFHLHLTLMSCVFFLVLSFPRIVSEPCDPFLSVLRCWGNFPTVLFPSFLERHTPTTIDI